MEVARSHAAVLMRQFRLEPPKATSPDFSNQPI